MTMAWRSWTWLPWTTLTMFAFSVYAESTMPPHYPLPKSTTREATIFPLKSWRDNEQAQVMCHYPISGNYCFLPRVLFYVTIIASLVLRHRPWLYAGALAASLTYSGSAAIHIIVMAISYRTAGDLDVIALAPIFEVSSAIFIILLYCSSTLQNAGNPTKQARWQKEKLDRLRERLKEWDQRQMHQINATRMGETNANIVAKMELDEAHHRRTFERRLSYFTSVSGGRYTP
ncbi:hypothetical protein BGZ63DRAFT_434611 [Mariannaea sp. PMI_226]|nr:hypothetical protein BGZ63DRAFT_434611 [Mariannaea sp. PMI_226]